MKHIVAFGAGLVAFLSPCVLPLLPGYVGFMTGAAVGERVPLRRALPGTLAFVASLTAVFVSLGAGASVVSGALSGHKRTLEIVSGTFVVLLGVFMLASSRGRLAFGLREKRFDVQPGPGVLRALALGAAFAFGWTPCIGPTLGAALNLAATSEGLARGVLLLLAYSAGMGVPFILAGLGLVSFGGRLKRWAPTAQTVGGVLLVAIGMLVLTGRLTLITISMQRFLTRIGLDVWNV